MVWLDFGGARLVSVVGACLTLNRYGFSMVLCCFSGWGFFESMWVGCFSGARMCMVVGASLNRRGLVVLVSMASG